METRPLPTDILAIDGAFCRHSFTEKQCVSTKSRIHVYLIATWAVCRLQGLLVRAVMMADIR